MLTDEVGRVRTGGPDREASGPEVVEHPPHQPVGHTLASELGIGLDMGNDNHLAVDAVVGDRDDAIIDV